MTEEITHVCRVSWGMVIGDSGEYIEKLIQDRKDEVKLALERAGFDVKDQHFIYDCEWGTLYTWATLIENPQSVYACEGSREKLFGYFYNEAKQRDFLISKK